MPDASEVAVRIDAELLRIAREGGADSFASPGVIGGDILERCGYFESFPGMAIPAPQGAAAFFTPAACYHVYPALRGRRLEAPAVITVMAVCGRNEKEAGPGRLRRFRMREVVFVGPPAWVSSTRDEWMTRASELARSLGLEGSMEPATDTFFGDPGRGRRLLQQLKRLKYELRMHAGGGLLAVASFNLHESFFTSRFDVAMADGTAAASGCAAFGLERWALACLARHDHAGL